MTSKLRVRRLGAPINGSGGGSNTTEVTTELLSFLNGVVLESVQNELQILNQTQNDFGDLKAKSLTATTSVISPLLQLGTGAPLFRNNGGIVEVRDSTNTALNPIRSNVVWLNELVQLRSANSPAGIFASVRNAANDGFVDFAAEAFVVSSSFYLKTISTSPFRGLRVEDSDTGNPIALDIQVRSLVAADAYINGNRWSTGSSVPSSPAVGDRWLETSSGVPVYGWWWAWNGTYWLSPEMRRLLSFDNVGATAALYFECDQNLDYFFSRLFLGIFVATTNSGTAYWNAQISRFNAANAATSIGSALTTQSLAADTNHALSTSPNIHVDVSATGARQFRVTLSRVSTPGNAFGAATVVFNYARP